MTEPASQTRVRVLRIAVRLAVSVLLIAWLLIHIDVTVALRLLGAVQGLWLAAALGSVLGTHLVNCWRWHWCLIDQGRRVSFRTLVVSYWTSLFVGLALPTEYGGDLLRIKDVWSHTASGAAAVASVLWSRLSGIAATFLVFSAAGLAGLDRLSELSLTWVWAVSLAICGALAVVIFVRPAYHLVFRLLERFPAPEKTRNRILEHLRELTVPRDIGWRIAALALVAQGLMILTNSLYAAALDQPVKALDMALVVPLVTLSSLLPISLGGIGVKEGAFVVCLSALGLSPEGALSVALLNRLVLIALALTGGLLFPFRHRLLSRPRRAQESELP